jgi:hypothetical protein
MKLVAFPEMNGRMGSKDRDHGIRPQIFIDLATFRHAAQCHDQAQSETRPPFSLVLLSFGFTTGARAGKPITGTVIESDHLYPRESQRVNANRIRREWGRG